MTCQKCGGEMLLVTCEWCLGSGDGEDGYVDCPFCNGYGQLRTCPNCEEPEQ